MRKSWVVKIKVALMKALMKAPNSLLANISGCRVVKYTIKMCEIVDNSLFRFWIAINKISWTTFPDKFETCHVDLGKKSNSMYYIDWQLCDHEMSEQFQRFKNIHSLLSTGRLIANHPRFDYNILIYRQTFDDQYKSEPMTWCYHIILSPDVGAHRLGSIWFWW